MELSDLKSIRNENPNSNLGPPFNSQPHQLSLDLREINKLFTIISQSDLDAVNEIVNNEIKDIKPYDRFAPYPIHRRLFMQQQHEQERRRQSMVISSRPSKVLRCFNESMLRTSRERGILRNKIVYKVILFIDTYSQRMCSKPNDLKEKCIVCMYNYQENEELRILQCNHKFHRKCVDEWLVTSYLCPVCRTQLVAGQTIDRVSLNLNSTGQTRVEGLIDPASSLTNE
ncbi:hypothetical protein FQR65_LT02971 [Abscondita terminalis]|nr:hypothetical protein FQR65_LT02971 [Abscondita terminalis]